MAREMKDSGIEWIGAIPNNWNCIDCKYIFKNEKKIVGPRENEYERLALTLNGVVKRSKDDSTGLQTERFDSYQILLPCELVFKMLDLKNISTSRVGFSPYKGIVSPAYIILKTEKNNVSKFFYYYFYNMWQRTIFNQMGNSGVRSSLTASDMLNLPVIVPDIHEQKNIANYLDKQCSEIDLLTADIEKQISVLEDYKKSVITEAVTKGLDPNVEMKDSGVEWIGKISTKAQIFRLKHLILEKMQYGANSAGTDYDEKLPRYIRITDITENGDLKLDGAISLSKEESENYILKEDDILFARSGASVGKTFLYKAIYGKSAFAGYLIKCRTNNKLLLPIYLYLYTKSSLYEEWKSAIYSQSTIQNISAEKYNELLIPVFDIKTQLDIVNYLEKHLSHIDALISEKKSQLEKLASYKQSMIYEYVTGKKEVPSKEIA